MKEKVLKHRKLLDILVIVLVGIFLCIPLLNKTTDVYTDDGVQHIARAYGTFLSFKNNFNSNVISSFANNFGYSWNLFYGPLSTYGIIAAYYLCSNFLNAYKLFVFLCLVLSGMTMYKLVLNLSKSNNTALLASILYITFPYHLTDLYIRNALGEYVSFIFIPLVFLGLYNLFYTTEKNYYLTIGAVGLILTHNISTVIVAFFSLLYLGLNFGKLKETSVKKGLIINIIFILAISSFFWIPLIEAKFSTDYQVYEKGMMATPENTAGHGLKITQLFVTQNDGSYVFELGPHILIMLALSIMAFRMIKTDIKETYGFFLIVSVLSLWMSTKYFPWKFLPEELCLIQFPWRMLMISGFSLSIVCAINMNTIIKRFNIKDVCFISLISIFYTTAFTGYILHDENISNIENWKLGYISGKEDETVPGTAKAEYLPKKAYENRFYIATREDAIYVLEGKSIIEEEYKDGGHLTANLKTLDAEYTIFELPYIYYPGYDIRLDGMVTDYFETQNGFVGIVMGAEDSVKLEVNYTGTKAMKYSLLISIISGICFLIYVWKKR